MPAHSGARRLLDCGVGGILRPADIPGLAFWHDPSDAATITLNVADVSAMADKTANARHASQGTAANQPFYKTAGINGKATGEYTGANNDSLAFASALGLARNVSSFAFGAVVQVGLAAVERIFTVTGGTGGSRFVVTLTASGILTATAKRLDADTQQAASQSSPRNVTANQPAFTLVQVDYFGARAFITIDNQWAELPFTTWAGGGNTSDTDSNAAPTYGRNGTAIITGQIGEAFGIANRIFSRREALQLRNHYRQKWGTA